MACVTQSHPFILRNSLIFILRHIMAQKSDEVRKNRIVKELNTYTTIPSLTQFLDNNGQDIRILYQGSNCWSSLKRAAGRISYTDDPTTKRLEKGVSNLIHHNTASFLHFVERFIAGEKIHMDTAYQTYTIMLYYDYPSSVVPPDNALLSV